MPTQTEKPKNQLRIILPMVRLSYPKLFKPEGFKGGKAKFSANFLLCKKEHATTIKQLEQLAERALLDKFGKKIQVKGDHFFLHDGNEREDREGYGDGVMYVVSKSDTRPAVVRPAANGAVEPVNEEDGVIYGGCYVDASIEVYAYLHKETGSKGVAAQLRAVRFRKDGQSFGGGGPVDAESEFESVPVEDGDDDPSKY